GDAGGAAAVAVVGPILGQVQLAVEQAVELADGIGQVDGDDAVVGLAAGVAPLPLHAGRLVALLGAGGVVDDRDRPAAGVLAGDQLLEPVAELGVVPLQQAEELLQGLGRD